MNREGLESALREKYDVAIYVNQIYEDKKILAVLIDILENNQTVIIYLGEKTIRKISEERPELLYPYFDRLSKFLNHRNQFIKLGFILTLPNLISVDKENRWLDINELYVNLLATDSITIFGNTVQSLYKILQKYPEYENDFMPILLKIESHIFKHKGEVSYECNCVARGHILNFLEIYCENTEYKKEACDFILESLECHRNSVRKKAKKLVEKYNIKIVKNNSM